MIRALSSAEPPASCAVDARRRPSAAASTVVPLDPVRRHVVEDAGPVERQLVDAVAVDDERPLRAEQPGDLGDPRRRAGSATPSSWRRVPAGFVERTEQVERRPDADLAPGRAGVLHRRVEARREEEREAVLAQGGPGRGGVVVDPDAERLEDVGRARRAT